MKRLFALIAAAMVFVGGYAQTTLFDFDGSEKTEVEFIGGTDITIDNKLKAYKFSKKYDKDNKYLKLTIGGGLKKGDVITIGVGGSGATGLSVHLFSDVKNPLYKSKQCVDLKKNEPIQESYTLQTDLDYICVGRPSSTGSTVYVKILKVVRPGTSKTESLTIAASGYTTYTASYPVDYSANNLTAYTVKYSSGTISYNEINGVVPANTPVLVAGTASQKYELAKAETDGKTVDTDLKAADGSTIKGDGTIYGFGTKNGVSGFRRVANDVVVPTNKAYLVINDAANSKEFFAFDNETTGIHAVESTTAKAEDGVAYSLSGQRVSDSYKGIVIINGKKVVRK